ncbi:hypothetical protein DV738_g2543, partial [Chaetothyriales sp. CBS 135597]
MAPPNNSIIPQLPVTKVRVVAHTLGPVIPGGQLSQNHWSIYLLNPDEGSVRLNMEWIEGTVGDKGTFTVKRYSYALTMSAVQSFDYDVKSDIKVHSFLELIGQKRRQNYKMTPTGVGCRFWVLTVFNDWVQAGLITTADAAQSLSGVIQFNYSRNQSPIALEMKRGEWL